MTPMDDSENTLPAPAPIVSFSAAPKSYKVARAFSTGNRRFNVGDQVAPADLASGYFDHLKTRGLIVAG
jgi:hypothetical protein